MPAPLDATADGQLQEYLKEFCTSRVQGRSKDELIMGKPFTDPLAQRTYFRASSFLQYLSRQRFGGVDEKRLWVWLSERGNTLAHAELLKGTQIEYWSVPAFQGQTQDHHVPRSPIEEVM